MSTIIMLLVIMGASYGAAFMILFGVSKWWLLANAPEDATEIDKNKMKGRAISLVSGGLVLWGFALVFVMNSSTVSVVLAILQAAGIDVSSIGVTQ